MRSFNRADSTRAPWNSGSSYANSFTQVVFLGRIDAQGSLAGMFEGCTRLTSADMRGLTITDATTDTSHMFSGCTSLQSVTNQNQATPYEAKLDMPEGVFLPATLNPVSAASMFEGCTGLADDGDTSAVVLKGFATRTAAVNLSSLFKGALSEDATVLMENVGAASTASGDLSSLFEGAHMPQISLSSVGGAATADRMFAACPELTKATLVSVCATGSFASLFEGCTNLTEASLTSSGNGDRANLTRMFANTPALTSVTLDGVANGNGTPRTSGAAGSITAGTPTMTDLFSGSTGSAEVTFRDTGRVADFTGAITGSHVTSLVLEGVARGEGATLAEAASESTFLKSATLTHVAEGSGVSLERMFAGCTSLATLADGRRGHRDRRQLPLLHAQRPRLSVHLP